MRFSRKQLEEVYKTIYREEEHTDLEYQEFQVMICLLTQLGDTISWGDLSRFTPYLKMWYPSIGYITEEILINQSENGIEPIGKSELVLLTESEISFYTTLAKRHNRNKKMFE